MIWNKWFLVLHRENRIGNRFKKSEVELLRKKKKFVILQYI